MARKFVLVLISFTLFLVTTSQAQNGNMSGLLRGRALNMLHQTIKTVEKNYYEPGLNGIDLKAREKEAEGRIAEAPNLSVALGAIAWVIDGLNDSHTRFIPPMRPYRTEVDWKVVSIGERCFISAVRPGSDAEAQGLKQGDELLAMDGFRVNRESLAKVQYAFNVLAPHSAHELVVVSPGQEPRKVVAQVKSVALPRNLESADDWMQLVRKSELDNEAAQPRWVEFNKDVLIFKLPGFYLSDGQIDSMFKSAQNHKTLVLDLRNDPGGAEEVLLEMLGHLFDHDIKVFDRVTRKGRKPVIAKTRNHQFKGKLIVLLNSGSASCSELFARTIQLEKRGLVIGDRSAGKVMESQYFNQVEGAESVAMYAVQITVGNLIMPD